MHFASRFQFAGQDFLADAAGVLYWPDEETLIVSDLHLEKGSSAAARSQRHLPPYDTRTTLAALESCLMRYRPRRVISLGDSFHDGTAHERMDAEDCARLTSMTGSAEWVWVAGNHDPAPPGCYGGEVTDAYRLKSITFTHIATPAGHHEVSGHFHPKAALVVRNARISGRCFVEDGTRMIMPAFGAYTGGLNVLDPAISDMLAPEFHVAIIGRTRVVRMPRHKLVA